MSENSLAVVGGSLENNANLRVESNSSIVVQGDLNNNAKLIVSLPSSASSYPVGVRVEGDLVESSDGVFVLVFNFDKKKRGASQTVAVNVTGYLHLNGTISLKLTSQPPQGSTTMTIISYNENQNANISSSQIQIVPNYNGSSCDTITSQVVNQQGSLGVAFTSILRNKCASGKNLGLMIDLSVGIPVGLALILGLSCSLLQSEKKKIRKKHGNTCITDERRQLEIIISVSSKKKQSLT